MRISRKERECGYIYIHIIYTNLRLKNRHRHRIPGEQYQSTSSLHSLPPFFVSFREVLIRQEVDQTGSFSHLEFNRR